MFAQYFSLTANPRQHQLNTNFVCQQFCLTLDVISEMFLGKVTVGFNYVNETADVLLSCHHVKLDRLQHLENWIRTDE